MSTAPILANGVATYLVAYGLLNFVNKIRRTGGIRHRENLAVTEPAEL
jgi:hypothetical protein